MASDACRLPAKAKEPHLAAAAEAMTAPGGCGSAASGGGGGSSADTGTDQVAIITGCASGIGRGTALAFAGLNYRLVLVDKQAERLNETGQLCAKRSGKNYKVSVVSKQQQLTGRKQLTLAVD